MEKIIKISTGIALIALMLILTFVWFRKNDAFILKSARVHNNQLVSEMEILSQAQIEFGKDIFKVDTGEIEARIKRNPMVEKVSVSRFLPSALKIKIKEKRLVASISGSLLAAVQPDGTVIEDYSPRALYDLPVITGLSFHESPAGGRIPKQPHYIKQAAAILNELRARDFVLSHEISELHFQQDRGIVLFLKGKRAMIILGKSMFAQKLFNLSKVYLQLKKQGDLNKVLALDLRYKDQVIVKYK
ncbi:MAG: cell division protein FtsQ/DivIB [Candidatus Zhuqueibacterota bacterium]